MLDLATTNGRIVAAALRLAGDRSWDTVTLAEIGYAAGVSLVDLRAAFSSKGEILAAFTRAVDDEVIAGASERAPDQSSRDAIFEVIMNRFDILAPYKPALTSIADSWPTDPAPLSAVFSSQAWMLRAAGVSPDGLDGQMRVVGLTALYASVFRTWLTDDDPGLAKTMAALDRRLRRGERTLRSVDGVLSTLRGLAAVVASRSKKAPPPTEPPPASEPPPEASV